MEQEKREELLTYVSDGIWNYFGTKSYAFYQDYTSVECQMYRSYIAHFDITEQGKLDISLVIDGQLLPLSVLFLEGDVLLPEMDSEALAHNFGVLDHYLRFRISKEQQETFGM
jgi:hypothetical protein